MRKQTVLYSLLFLLATVSVILSAYIYVELRPSSYSPEPVSTPAVLSEEDSGNSSTCIEDLLNLKDFEWHQESMQYIAEARESLNANEETRRQLELQKERVKEEFLKQRLEQAREQAELLERMREEAQEEVTALGGTDLTFAPSVSLGSTSKPPSVSVVPPTPYPDVADEASSVPSERKSESVIGGLTKSSYYGQFAVTCVCGCADCNNGVLRENEFLVDSSVVPDGVTVSLDSIPGILFETVSSSDVTERDALVVCNIHDIAVTRLGTIYPKVTAVN